MDTHQYAIFTRTKIAGYLSVLGFFALRWGGPSMGLGAEAAESKNAVSDLVGTYPIVSGEKDGQKSPDERVQGSTVRITQNTITTYDKDQKETYAVTYEAEKRARPVDSYEDEHHRPR